MKQLLLSFLACATLAACASGAPSSGSSATNQSSPASPSAPKRIVAAIQGDPLGGYQKLDSNNSQRGNTELAVMVHAGLTVTDSTGALQPELAEAVPSIDNGLWTIGADGSMETRWKIRDGAKWHDGTPLTSDDLVFTLDVVRDRDVPIFRDPSYPYIASVEAIDPQTISVHWKKAYIDADRTFSDRVATPLPKHLLEAPYNEDKTTFTQLPYWSSEFVGLGPYKVKDWQRGSSITVEANDAFVLGRPKIDEIELRIIPDTNAIVANLLSGSVDMTLGRSISLDQVVQLRDRMPDALIQTPLTSLLVLNPQMLNPDPVIIADVNFRKAVMYALDRKEMADSINYGLVPVAEQFVYPDTAEAKATEGSIVHYDYDPRRAAQMVESLGYAKGSDGFYHDSSGQQLRFEVRATAGEANPKTMSVAADYLQKLGIGVDQVIIPAQLLNDQKYRATFPGMIVNGGPADTGMEDFHSSRARLPENDYSGRNRSRYMNPELDGMIDGYSTTIPFEARMNYARQITHHVTDNLPALPLIFDSWPSATASRIQNVAVSANGGMATWNVINWDVKS